jgi:hypothetical protein
MVVYPVRLVFEHGASELAQGCFGDPDIAAAALGVSPSIAVTRR